MQKLYYGGDIVTMVKESDAPQSLLTKDGKIQFVGSLSAAEQLCAQDVVRIDLKGKTLMPSFIDGHSHLSQYALFSVFPDISGCTSFAEIVIFLKNYIKEHALTDDDILLATGYDHNFLKEEAHPTRAVLDEASDKIPIYLYHSSGHMGVINTPMMKLAGIDENAPDPQGGRYGREKDKTFNGYMEEMAAFAPVLLKVFEKLPADSVKQLVDVQNIYLKYGITTVQDGGTNMQTLRNFLKMADKGLFRVDVVSYLMFNEAPQKALEEYKDYAKKYKNHFKIAGAKIFLDGSPQGKSAWLTSAYEGETEYRGYPTQTDKTVIEAAKNAISHNYQLLAHCNGDAASEQYIACYKKVLEELNGYDYDLRPVMIHCQTVRDDQLKEMAEISMLPSFFVAHTYYWGDVHLKNLGSVRGNHISPVKSALSYDLKYNFHQDCPVLAPDMMKTIWCAVNRITRKGVKIGENQCISVFDALKGITINAAYAYHEEDSKGTLETGKLADMVILEKNPLKTDKKELADIQVYETIKEGITLFAKEHFNE